MTRFESEIKDVNQPASAIYQVLSNFDNFGHLLPEDKISNWQSFGDSCRFEVVGLGQFGLKIVNKDADKMVKYTADGSVPFNFFLWVQLKEIDSSTTKIKVTLDADLNPMLKMVTSGPLKKFIGLLAEAIASHTY